MRLLYITQRVNEEGGVQRVLAVKTNYLIEKWGYEIAVITQNGGNSNVFFEFNKEINFYDISLNKNKLWNLFEYKKQIENYIKLLKPDCIIVCDFALKSFSIPILLNTKIPIIFEAHGSRFNEHKESIAFSFINKLKYKYRNYCGSKFLYFIALSKESLDEWTLKNGVIISNPLWFKANKTAALEAKKIIVIARQSYEKGIDRLLQVWQLAAKKHPDWILEIYGKSNPALGFENLIKDLGIDENVCFLNSVKNIEEKYNNASIYVMTSRNEALPMVLIEAMAAGLPCIAYDCPVGPRAIIKNNENGFLIEDGNKESFVEKLNLLIEDEELRKKMGQNARSSVDQYNLETIMLQWKNLFETIVKA